MVRYEADGTCGVLGLRRAAPGLVKRRAGVGSAEKEDAFPCGIESEDEPEAVVVQHPQREREHQRERPDDQHGRGCPGARQPMCRHRHHQRDGSSAGETSPAAASLAQAIQPVNREDGKECRQGHPLVERGLVMSLSAREVLRQVQARDDGAQIDDDQAECAEKPSEVVSPRGRVEGKELRCANIALENHLADWQCPSLS